MKLFSKVKELFSRERLHQRPGSIRAQISDKLRSWGHSIKRTRAEGTNSYTETPVQTSTSMEGNSLLHFGIVPTSISDLSDIIQQYLPGTDHSTSDNCSVGSPVLVLVPSQPINLPFSPYSGPPAASEISIPPVPSSATVPPLIHSAVPNTSSNNSTHTAVSSAGSNKSLSTNTDYSDGLPATATHVRSGEHTSFQERDLTKTAIDIPGDSNNFVPRVEDLLLGDLNSDTNSTFTLGDLFGDSNNDTSNTFTTSHKGVREEVEVQTGQDLELCDLGMAERGDSVVQISSDATSTKSEDTAEVDKEAQKPLDRHDWDTIHKIPDLYFKQLLLSTISQPESDPATIDGCSVNARFDGGFNHVVFMTMMQGLSVQRLVVRVPAIGTVARWQEGDAHNMRCEMALLEHLHKTTNIPVPEVLAFADNLDTPIGAPFCIMKQLRGKPAHRVWFEDTGVQNHITANAISAETEAKRCKILRSLAHAMAELQTLTFDKIGTPDLVNPSSSGKPHHVTHTYRWKSPQDMEGSNLEDQDQVSQYGPFDSSKDYMISDLDSAWPNTPYPDLDQEDQDEQDAQNVCFGMRKILDLIYAQPVIISSKLDLNDASEKESFVLRHPDLDFQNILVDDAGNVTGIIDWEGCMAVPRCVGYASVPDFLRRDWYSDYSLRRSPHMTWQLEHYRHVYADAMQETGAPEAKYTFKSAMYRAVADSVDHGSPTDLIKKLCVQISGLRTTDVDELEQYIGEGWPEAEEYLDEELRKLFEPELF